MIRKRLKSRRADNAQHAKRFLKLWKQVSVPFGKSVRKALNEQRKQAVERFKDLAGLVDLRKQFSADDANKILPPGDSDKLIRDAANQHIKDGMAKGVKLVRVNKQLSALSLEMQEHISDVVDEIFNESYWSENVGDSTRRRIANVLFRAIQEGWSIQETAAALENDRFGIFDMDRALRIARTESTGAVNGGQWIARRELIAEGIVKGERWLGILDNSIRNDHRKAHNTESKLNDAGKWVIVNSAGEEIADGKLFVVGNERARYPGDPKLSARNRVRCRCTTQSIL